MIGSDVIVGSGASDVVVRVGPVAWVVLERTAQRATVDGEHLVAHASVRSVAAELGLAKDTVARAVVRLRRAGLVEHVAARFEPGLYRLTIPADALRLERSARESRPLRPRHGIDIPLASQLSLLDRD